MKHGRPVNSPLQPSTEILNPKFEFKPMYPSKKDMVEEEDSKMVARCSTLARTLEAAKLESGEVGSSRV